MRAALYSRVSTVMQTEQGFSLDAQMDRLRSYCDSQGWTISGVYTDEGVSAKDTDRPALRRLLGDMEAGLFDVVLVYKLDRLTRSVGDLYTLLQTFEKSRIGFKSATEVFDTTTAMGRLFITIVGAMAQWEREQLAERTRMGMVQMTKEGRWSGGRAAFGYEYVDGQLVIHEAQAMVVREIFRRYTTGEGSFRILQWLNDPDNSQLAPRKRWTLNALKYCLRNPLYAGYVRFGYRDVGGRRNDTFQIAKGLHEPIIDIETWEAAERAKKQRATQPSRLGTGTFALSGLLYCGRCGAAMSGVTYYRKNKAESPPRRYYACGEREHNNLCKMPRILEAEIESKLISDIERDYRDLSRRARKATHTPKTSNVRESLEQELRKVRERKQRWMDAFEEGTIDAKDMRNRLDDLNERENSVLQQILLVNEPVEPDYRIQAELLRSLVRTWEHANVADRKDMLRTLISRIELTDDRTLRVEYK